ncbi:MAG: two-component sensor histidine kinase, partial [Mesorhizobium sp.]|uniref:ATP-binding protein n=1 Tax=Mesorhizobium sp. TaxID=1871066 RepID=UPI000FE8D5F3
DEERDKWLHDLDELDRIADSAIRLVREEVNQDAVEPLDLEKMVRDISAEMATLGHSVSIGHLDKVSVRAGALSISDVGPGIPPDLINKAFEPFFRVDPGRQQFIPGAGLGLAIAKEIIERYGGTVTLENRQGGGLAQTVVFAAV